MWFPSAQSLTIQKPGNWLGIQIKWLISIYTIRDLTKRYFRIGYINPSITHPLSQYNIDINNNNKKSKITSYSFFLVLLSLVLNCLIAHSTDCQFLRNFVFLWGSGSTKFFSLSWMFFIFFTKASNTRCFLSLLL